MDDIALSMHEALPIVSFNTIGIVPVIASTIDIVKVSGDKGRGLGETLGG